MNTCRIKTKGREIPAAFGPGAGPEIIVFQPVQFPQLVPIWLWRETVEYFAVRKKLA
jgi:hypothetical protein